MDRSLQKQVAQMYPKKNSNFKGPRTPSGQAMQNQIVYNPPQKEHFEMDSLPKIDVKTKKFFVVLIITLLGGLLFSSKAYTITDDLSSKLNLELFDQQGNPSMGAVIFHMVVFGLLIYLIIYGAGY
jgi:hypothetical protein